MSVKPIIFSGPMVRALLDGRKTMTRRVLKGNLLGDLDKVFQLDDGSWHHTASDGSHMSPVSVPYICGDLLWVRESIDKVCASAGDEVAYMADWRGDPRGLGWRPSIHMPRWASRLTLEVTDVRVERVQDISEEDAKAEGAEYLTTPCDHPRHTCEEIGCAGTGYRLGFADLWHSINEKRGFGWDANPWVVALTFTIHKQNVADFMKKREAA